MQICLLLVIVVIIIDVFCLYNAFVVCMHNTIVDMEIS